MCIIWLDEGVHPHAKRGKLRGRRVVEQPLPSTALDLVALSWMIGHGFGIIVRLDKGVHPPC